MPMPMQSTTAPNPEGDPNESQMGEMDEGQEGDTGFTVCIRVEEDGSMSVGVEGATMQPATDTKDALTKALALIKADGKPTAEDQFDRGFTGVSGQGSM